MKERPPSTARDGRAFRAKDIDGNEHWYCDYTGARIGTWPGRYGYYCPGHHVVFQNIIRTRAPR
jgi:hypothetical protein